MAKKLIRAEHYIVKDYWLAYYTDKGCTLCGNSGVIDTTSKSFGRLNWCICPNGQAYRKATKGENPYKRS